MPKIGKGNFTIKNEHIDLEIWYSSKLGFYYKDLPEEFKALTKFHERRFEKENDLRNTFLCTLEEYHKQITKQRKVIIYRLYGSSEMVMNKNGDLSYSGTKAGVSKKFSTPDGLNDVRYLFGFSYDVVIEFSGRTIEFHRIMPDGSIRQNPYRRDTSRNEYIIDWTPEREKFFKDLQSNLQNLIGMVSVFFDQDNLLELMDSGIGKMLGAGSVEPHRINDPVVEYTDDVEDYVKILIEVRKAGGNNLDWYKQNCKTIEDISKYGIEKYLITAVREGLVLNSWINDPEEEVFSITEKGIKFTNKYFK